MSISTMGVTDNARLLLGYIAGALMRDDIYVVESADPEAGTQIVAHARTGNRYLTSVEQMDGTQ